MAAGIMPASPTHAWAFDEGTGSTAYPAFGDQTGTLLNEAHWSTDAPLSYGGNYSVEFQDKGGQGRVRFPGHYSGTAGSFQFWVYTTEMTGGDYYMQTGGGATGRMYLWTADASTAGLGIDNKGMPYFTRPPDDIWNHIAVTWDASLPTDNVTVYVTNSLGQNVHNFTSPNDGGDTGSIYMGNPGWGTRGFLGSIDELAYWSVPLTADNVDWLYENSASSIPEPATATLAVLSTLGLLLVRRRKRI